MDTFIGLAILEANPRPKETARVVNYDDVADKALTPLEIRI